MKKNSKKKNSKTPAPKSLESQLVLNRLNRIRENPRVAAQENSKATGIQIAVALAHLKKHGYDTEVDNYYQLVTAATVKKSSQQAEQLTLKGRSLLVFAEYLITGKDEAVLLRTLPILFALNAPFFLKEQWIQELFAQWLQQGESEKIEKAVAGSTSTGRRDYKTIRENMVRDEKIVAAVKKLREEGWGYNEAMKQVAANLKSLGITTQVSPNAIQKIYHEWTKGTPGFVKYYRSL